MPSSPRPPAALPQTRPAQAHSRLGNLLPRVRCPALPLLPTSRKPAQLKEPTPHSHTPSLKRVLRTSVNLQDCEQWVRVRRGRFGLL